MNVKQAVIVRRDLNVKPGLLAAQVAHLSSMWMIDRIGKLEAKTTEVPLLTAQSLWIKSPTLVVLGVTNNEELEVVYQRVDSMIGDEAFVWHDTIYSELFRTYLYTRVGLVVGPLDDEKLKQYVGDLPLY